MLLNWADKYSVGVREIDDQHKELIAIINELHEHMGRGSANAVLEEVFARLLAYTDTHFATEERLMGSSAFPGLQAHKEAHEALLKQARELQRGFEAGELLLSLKVMEFLKEWLVEHIMGEDKKLGAFLTAQGIH
jgi:hemerythrin